MTTLSMLLTATVVHLTGVSHAAPTLSVQGPCPGPVVFDVVGATPSGTVAIASANGPGAFVIPSGNCAGTIVRLGSAGLKLRATPTADGAGQVSLPVPPLPAQACGAAVQAVDLTTCEVSNVVHPAGGNAFWESCDQILQAGESGGDGPTILDPCGTGDFHDYYCDMTRGGWTLAGRQDANASTEMGIADAGVPGVAPWSNDLACVPYSEIVVVNVTFGDAHSQALPPGTWAETLPEFEIAAGATAFRMGDYGGAATMACVDYGVGTPLEWACDNDLVNGQAGNLTEFAGEFCPGGRLDGTWAWADGTTCKYRGQPYLWSYGIR